MNDGRPNMAELFGADLEAKPGGADYDRESAALSSLFERRSRLITLDHLKTIGMGDFQNIRVPIEIPLLQKVIQTRSVLYRTPAGRFLTRDGDDIDEESDEAETFDRILSKMTYDSVWGQVDAARNLYHQVALSFAESAAHRDAGCAPVQMRFFEPHNLVRMPSRDAADLIENDRAFALRVDGTIVDQMLGNGIQQRGQDIGTSYVQALPPSSDPKSVFQLFWKDSESRWHMQMVRGTGDALPIEQQPYKDNDGLLPFGDGMICPVMMVYDQQPNGRPYIPMDQTRKQFALNINATANEIMLLVKMEGHSTPWVKSDDPAAVPNVTGPGVAWKIPGNAEVGVLDRVAQIESCIKQIEDMKRNWAITEDLPSDSFGEMKDPVSATALKLRQADLDAARSRQKPMAAIYEDVAFRKLRAIHNFIVGKAEIPTDVELRLEIASSWQPIDAKEFQQTSFAEMAIGVKSKIDYVMGAERCTRREAIERLQRVDADSLLYPIAPVPAAMSLDVGAGDRVPPQNPGALLNGSGPKPALGPGMMQKVPGAFNPQLGTSTEGASVTDAVRRRMGA